MCAVTVFFPFSSPIYSFYDCWEWRNEYKRMRFMFHVLGCRNRRKEGKNLRELKRIMISNKIRFISMKIRLQIQTLFFSRFSYHFGINSILVNWMLSLLDEHVWASIPLSKMRALFPPFPPPLSIYVSISIFIFVCTYVSCSFCFRSMQKSNIDHATKRTHNNNSSAFRKTKKKQKKLFPSKLYSSSCHNNVIEFAQSKSTWENFSFKLLSLVGGVWPVWNCVLPNLLPLILLIWCCLIQVCCCYYLLKAQSRCVKCLTYSAQHANISHTSHSNKTKRTRKLKLFCSVGNGM